MITMRILGVLPLCFLVFAAMLFGPGAMAQPRELRVSVSSAQLDRKSTRLNSSH